MRAPADGVALDAAQTAAANAGLKCMMPIAGRPFLDYVLHSLAEAGIDDVVLVVGPSHDAAREHYAKRATARLRITFATQAEPLGTADAVLAGESWAGETPFLVLNSDNLYPADVLRALVDARGPALPGFARDSLGLPLDRTGAFALIEEDDRRCLSRIVEKPGIAVMAAAGPAARVSMNVWRFDARIFAACRDVALSMRGEKELPEAVGLAVSRGICFHVIPARGPVLDLSSRSDVGTVEASVRAMEVRL
jgi:glucose-1-phosphate thymidylyltransferase